MAQDNTQNLALPVVPAVDLDKGWGGYVTNVQAGSDTPTDLTPVAQRGTITRSTPLAQNPAPVSMPAPAPAPVPMQAQQSSALPVAAPQNPAQTATPTTPMQEYMQALNQYKAVLDQQSAQGSQTPWFQIAGALLNPGRTGSFGEAVGNAANVMGAHQAEQQKMQIPLAQARLGLIKSKYELGRQAQNQEDFKKALLQGQNQEDFTKILTGDTTVSPGVKVAPTGETLTVASAHPDHTDPTAPGAPDKLTMVGAEHRPTAPLLKLDPTVARAYIATHKDDIEGNKLLVEMLKMDQPNVSIDSQTGALVNTKNSTISGYLPGYKAIPEQTPWGTYPMPPEKLIQYRNLPDNVSRLQFLKDSFGENDRGLPRSQEDIALKNEVNKTLGTERSKLAIEKEKEILTDSIAAQSVLPVYKAMDAFSNLPQVKNHFGDFSKGGPGDAMRSMLTNDHTEKALNNVISSIQRVLSGETPESQQQVIAAVKYIESLRGIAENEYAKNAGLNARMSDYRTKFLTDLHPSPRDDTPESYQAKLNGFIQRAQWPIERHQLFNQLHKEDPTIDGYSFYGTNEYKNKYNSYLENQSKVPSFLQTPAVAGQSAAPTPATTQQTAKPISETRRLIQEARLKKEQEAKQKQLNP